MLQFCKKKYCKNIYFYKNQRYCITAHYIRGTLEHTPQNVCLLCNLVRFGLHFLRTFSEANIYEYLSSIFFANFSACAYAPPPSKILIKLHVWSIYLIKFPHLLSIRGACTPEKLFLSGAI